MGGNKKIIIANWKMHFTVKQAVSYAAKLAGKTLPAGVEVVIAPHMLALPEIAIKLQKTHLKLAAQNAFHKDEGAFTGEVAMHMLRGFSKYVLVGHSERRHIFGETNDQVRDKVAAAVHNDITPVICIGETLIEREDGHTRFVLHDQLVQALANLTAEEVASCVVAYEPVWAISSGKDFQSHPAATPDDAQAATKLIRSTITELYGDQAAKKVRVLYGGSSSPENAKAFLETEGVDGLLVGGASLNLHSFWTMVEKAAQPTKTKIEVKKEKS